MVADSSTPAAVCSFVAEEKGFEGRCGCSEQRCRSATAAAQPRGERKRETKHADVRSPSCTNGGSGKVALRFCLV